MLESTLVLSKSSRKYSRLSVCYIFTFRREYLNRYNSTVVVYSGTSSGIAILYRTPHATQSTSKSREHLSGQRCARACSRAERQKLQAIYRYQSINRPSKTMGLESGQSVNTKDSPHTKSVFYLNHKRDRYLVPDYKQANRQNMVRKVVYCTTYCTRKITPWDELPSRLLPKQGGCTRQKWRWKKLVHVFPWTYRSVLVLSPLPRTTACKIARVCTCVPVLLCMSLRVCYYGVDLAWAVAAAVRRRGRSFSCVLRASQDYPYCRCY